MNFNSIKFLIFLPTVLVVYWMLSHSVCWVWLLAVSYYFYMQWNAELLILILVVTLLSYLTAILVERSQSVFRKKLYLLLDISVCLGILIYFKYIDFLLGSIASVMELFSIGMRIEPLEVILPIGISFYTFQALSYVIDVYQKKIPAETHLGYFSLYVVFFPQLVAGPIESAGALLPQLKQKHPFSVHDLAEGLCIMLCGFFRKCVVADFCGTFVDNVFADLSMAGPIAVFAAGALFCIQMYCDFAGYSEIAQGAAKMMGIDLMKNFDRPYFSTSYTEFFRRWHISLNRWFTEYVYVPLGGNRKGKARKVLNTVIVFALCGLWHGPNWTYVCWGLYAAFFVCMEGLLKRRIDAFFDGLGGHFERPFVVAVRRSIMFLIFIPAALLFRSPSIDAAIEVLLRLFSIVKVNAPDLHTAMDVLGMDGASCLQLVMRIVCMGLIYDYGAARRRSWGTRCSKGMQKTQDSVYVQYLTVAVYMTITIFLCWVSLASTEGVSKFAYFQF